MKKFLAPMLLAAVTMLTVLGCKSKAAPPQPPVPVGAAGWSPIPSPGVLGKLPFSGGIATQAQWASGLEVPVQLFGAKGDGATDDSAAFQAGVTALSGTGAALYVPGATYAIKATVLLPSNVTIQGGPGARIIATVPGGTVSNDPFLAQPSATLGTSTTILAATPVLYASTVSVNTLTLGSGTIAAGMFLGIANAPSPPTYRAAMYKVVSVTGAGPYTVTLDRPMVYVFASTDQLTLVQTIPQNIKIAGLQMSGTCTRYVELASCRNCSVEDVQIDTVSGHQSDSIMSFDVGSYNAFYRRVTGDLTGAPGSWGLTLESCESCGAEDCNIRNFSSGAGYVLMDCYGAHLENDKATGCSTGVILQSQDATYMRGCNYTRILGGNYDANVSFGIQLSLGTTYTQATDFTANGNGSIGVYLDGTGTAMRGNIFRSFAAQNNVSYDVEILAGAKDTTLASFDVSNTGTGNVAPLAISDDAHVTDMLCVNPSTQTNFLLAIGGAAVVDVKGAKLSSSVASTPYVISVNGSAVASFSDINVKIGSGNYGLVTAGTAIAKLSNALFAPIGSQSGETGVDSNSAGSLIELGLGVDLTASANPLNVSTGTITMSQGRGVFTSSATTGTETLSQVQAKAEVIQTAQSLTGNVTENVPSGVKGLRYVVFDNATLNAHTWSVGVTGGTAISIGAGKRAVLESDGTNMQRVSPDT